MLQNRIEQLEQLLEENHEIISHIKDSVLELTAHAEGQPPPPPHHPPNGSWVLPPESRPSFLSVSPQDCQFALGGMGQSPDLQVRGWCLGASSSGPISTCFTSLPTPLGTQGDPQSPGLPPLGVSQGGV